MKRNLLILLMASMTVSLLAQDRPYRIGIKGGVSFVHLENYGNGYYSDFDPLMGYSIGALFQYTKGGFVTYSVVPEIQFTSSVTDVDLIYITDCITTIQSVDVPVSLKVGLQLSRIFRPYVVGTLYGSYIVTYKGDFFELLDLETKEPGQTINRFYFGVATGLGFDIWKFQIEGRYRWNLNRINADDYAALKQMGLELTCAFLF